jgi:hypothetical protein
MKRVKLALFVFLATALLISACEPTASASKPIATSTVTPTRTVAPTIIATPTGTSMVAEITVYSDPRKALNPGLYLVYGTWHRQESDEILVGSLMGRREFVFCLMHILQSTEAEEQHYLQTAIWLRMLIMLAMISAR